MWTKRFVAFLGYGKERAQGQTISSDSSIIDNDRSTRPDELTSKAAPASKQLIRLKK